MIAWILGRILLVLSVLGLLSASLAHAVMPLPTGKEVYSYPSTESPVVNVDPSQARPVTVGPNAEGDDPLRLRVSLDAFAGPVNVHLAVFFPTVDPHNIYLLKPNGSFQSASNGLVPWKTNTTGPINEPLFGDLPSSILPAATYHVWLLVSPSQSLDVFYLWMTKFFVGGWTFDEVENKILVNLGEDAGFDAIMFAFEKGYSLAQVTEAAVTNRLQSTGDIASALGGLETADDNASVLFTRSIQKEKKDAPVDIGIDQLRGLAKDSAKRQEFSVLVLILALSQGGYSPKQITEGILLDRIRPTPDHGERPAIVDENDSFVEPENVIKGVIQTAWLVLTLKGPKILYLKDDKAKGEWTVTAVGGKPPYYFYAFFYGSSEFTDVQIGPFETSNRSWTFSQEYTKAGNYMFRGKAQYGTDSEVYRSNIYEVEVREPIPLEAYTKATIMFGIVTQWETTTPGQPETTVSEPAKWETDYYYAGGGFTDFRFSAPVDTEHHSGGSASGQILFDLDPSDIGADFVYAYINLEHFTFAIQLRNLKNTYYDQGWSLIYFVKGTEFCSKIEDLRAVYFNPDGGTSTLKSYQCNEDMDFSLRLHR